MTNAASDDLIARVRAYLSGLEPPVRADDLTDEEVAGVTLAALEWLDDEMLWLLLPERFRPPPQPARPPFSAEFDQETQTVRVRGDTRYSQFLEYGTDRRPAGSLFLNPTRPVTPSGPPPAPR